MQNQVVLAPGWQGVASIPVEMTASVGRVCKTRLLNLANFHKTNRQIEPSVTQTKFV